MGARKEGGKKKETLHASPVSRLQSRAWSILLSRVLARRTTKKERLQIVYNKTAVHVLLVVEHNLLPPSLVAV